jgi:hypothetical protein
MRKYYKCRAHDVHSDYSDNGWDEYDVCWILEDFCKRDRCIYRFLPNFLINLILIYKRWLGGKLHG